MAQNQAAPLPPREAGEFRFITNALTADGGQDHQPRRFRAVASSTVTDLAGNTISLNALNQLRDDFRNGLTIFMDHDYTNVVDKVFGTSDNAEVVPTPEKDARTGATIYDLIIEGVVNEPNPRAVQLHDSIAGGYVKFGTSIGAIVRKHTRDKQTGGMLIDSITGKEASIVGIPKNQRSWAYKASVAAAELPDDEALADDEPEEEQVVAANGELLQQWVVKPTDGSNSITTTGTIDNLVIGDPPVETLENLLAAVTTAPDSGGALVRQGVCPTCGHDAGCDCTTCDCAGSTHDAQSSVTDGLLTNADATSDDTTPGGQEAPLDEVATPETAPTVEDTPDPAIEQQADIATEDVAALISHVQRLVIEVGNLREENARLVDEKTAVEASVKALSTVEQDATEAIRRVMAMPLRRRAVGHVEDFTARYPGLDPRVAAYITRKENE